MSYTVRTNMTDSVFYSTKCIIWEILRRLTPRSARRDNASASYGRSKLTVVAISTFKLVSDAWGRGAGNGVTATAHNKLSSLLYTMISKRPELNDDIMESFAKQIGTDFVTLEVFERAG